MTVDELLGRRVTLRLHRLTGPGAFLGVGAGDTTDDAPGILLPGGEVPAGAKVGDEIMVFVHLDAEERPIATTRPVKLTLGEATFLTVTAATEIGAFVDWGLGKELLVPFAQQSKEAFVGERQPIGLYLDKSRRLAGTMFVGEMLDQRPHAYRLDQWVVGEAWRNDPAIGLFAILDRSFVGLVPASEPHRLLRGESAKFRVGSILPDGKVVLSLRQHAHHEIEGDAERILAVLRRAAGGRSGPAPKLSDRISPETIRSLFGISKKAYKRAVGKLLVDKAVKLDDEGCLIVVTATPAME